MARGEDFRRELRADQECIRGQLEVARRDGTLGLVRRRVEVRAGTGRQDGSDLPPLGLAERLLDLTQRVRQSTLFSRLGRGVL